MKCWILMYDANDLDDCEQPEIHGVVQFKLQAKQWEDKGYNYCTKQTTLFDDDVDPAELEADNGKYI